MITSVKTLLDSGTVWKVAGRTWTPEMVALQIFLALKESVEKRRGADELKEAVVAVPIGFSAGKRAALRRAARMAGIEIKGFISEPTAAMFCHYGDLGHHTRLAVFDWGGGTLDISVLENRNGRVKELATAGLKLGGDDIDRLMAERVHSKVAGRRGKAIPFDEMPPPARDKMLAACEQAKKDFTWDDRVEISILDYGALGNVHLSLDIESFSAWIRPAIDRAIQCFEDCIRQAGLNLAGLDCILMVGGSVNFRPLSERVAEIWEGKEVYPEDSDWSVARGAASLSVRPGGHLLAQTIGVTMSDGSLYPLLREGDTVEPGDCTPATFALVEDEPAANFIFADDRGNTLGYMNVPTFGFFREKIEVRPRIDENLVLHVRTRNLNKSSRTAREWCYESLRMDYQLPVTGLEVAEDEP